MNRKGLFVKCADFVSVKIGMFHSFKRVFLTNPTWTRVYFHGIV